MFGFKLTPDALNDMLDIARYTEHQWGKNNGDTILIYINLMNSSLRHLTDGLDIN